jgi:hypothetical protein
MVNDVKQFEGKTVRELNDEQFTSIELLENEDLIKNSILDPKWLHYETRNDLGVLSDFKNNQVLCFENDELVTAFICDGLRYASFDDKLNVAKAKGSKTTHEYHFESGEYKESTIK